MIEKYLTTEQVAEILQVHTFTILRYLKKGKLKGIKLGRVYRIKESDVYEFLESVATTPSEKSKQKKEPKSETEIKQEPKELESKESDPEVEKRAEKSLEKNQMQTTSDPIYTLSHQDNFGTPKDDNNDNQTYYVI